MKRLRIRNWMLVGVSASLVLPGLTYELTRSIASPWPPPDGGALPLVVAAIVLGMTVTIVSVQIGRAVVRPLEAMSRAALRVAQHELDFTLPDSAALEISRASEAFGLMRDGLQASLHRQVQMEEERRFLLSAIAHDLRTPLFALRGYLEGLDSGLADTPDKAARYVRVCREKADLLERMVSDLFEYTRSEALELIFRPGPVNFAELMDRVADGFKEHLDTDAVQLDLIGGRVDRIHADAHLLERALGNLVDNALAHTEAGGHVTISWRQEPGRLAFAVADTGPGFAPDDLPHVFEPFHRGDASRSRDEVGAGLGLTIAKRILEVHGGALAATNLDGRGAVIDGWIPLAELRGNPVP